MTELKNNTHHNKRLLWIGGIISLLVAIVLIFLLMPKSENRSISGFCSEVKNHKDILRSNGNYEAKVEAYKKVEAVAPTEILSDITTIRKGFESVASDPSKSIGAGLGIAASENKRDDYISKNCPDIK